MICEQSESVTHKCNAKCIDTMIFTETVITSGMIYGEVRKLAQSEARHSKSFSLSPGATGFGARSLEVQLKNTVRELNTQV